MMMSIFLGIVSNSVPGWDLIMFSAVICAVASFGVVHIVKMAVDGYRKSKGKTDEPWWRNILYRSLSILVALGVGALLVSPIVNGMLIGVCSGIMNTVLVMSVKKFIKSFIAQKTGSKEEE